MIQVIDPLSGRPKLDRYLITFVMLVPAGFDGTTVRTAIYNVLEANHMAPEGLATIKATRIEEEPGHGIFQ